MAEPVLTVRDPIPVDVLAAGLVETVLKVSSFKEAKFCILENKGM